MGDLVDVAAKVAMLLLSAGAVYGGIRADLKGAHRKAEEAMTAANRAHDRLDDHIQYGRRHDD